ncbi:hypothetical protein Ana3638_09260 [Anaerocolumna sedimenticola]|uniref:Uncharacterized protein n=1 Tax=Anaerocolumna sedimenticola TaxID=2696063 RepID=A0A6P1TIH2_9FIRM|nr:beta-L-arabinofuranosidase domain-containing protein [Anaerocolumna sedimenticola]QHQ60934.1 hypothetical protein Ana3638_09260 [Anaerocolumna sedimenticola]
MNKLKKQVFTLLPTQDLKPQGWLLEQLQIQADGLSGNLDKFWPDIKESKWIGGDKEGWERVPYWLDGFIPLAWLLDKEDMKARASRYIDFIIKQQDEDGWICPGEETDRNQYDIWALFLILKVLVLYHDFTQDNRIEEVVKKALLNLDRHIDSNLLFSWAQTRWYECLISIWWLYERTGEEWLLNLASKLHCQGFDWIKFFRHWPYKNPDGKGRWSQMSHVVNNAMALKSGALISRMTGDYEQLHSAEKMVELLDEYHGMVTGVFTGDECLAGKSPVQGTELCAVAEYMYSLEHLIAITGRAYWGDRLEKIGFNALPATFSPDMWSHQYDQQVNQVECSRREEALFNTNGGEAHLFGLEPNFGCCTANLSQPWPKFAMNTILKAEDGFAVILYAPMSVQTVFEGINVNITMVTDYPFKDIVHFKINTDSKIRFSLRLRVPAWCQTPEINIAGIGIKKDNGEFMILEKEWDGETEFLLKLPMKAELVERPNGLYSIVRGPLVYALEIKEKWVQINQNIVGREYPHCDYEIYAQSPWNYGLRINEEEITDSIHFEEREVGKMPFSPANAPIKAKVKGSKIDWPMINGSAAVKPELNRISDEIEELTLIPYGCTNLRLTEMPIL